MLKEGFDGPTVPVEVGDACRAPFQIVGEKHHLLFLAVDFHQRHDAAQQTGVILRDRRVREYDEFIAQDLGSGHGQCSEDLIGHVLLGTGDPGHAPLVEIAEVKEIQIRLVEDHDLPGANACAKFPRTQGVIFPAIIAAVFVTGIDRCFWPECEAISSTE